MGCQDMRPEIDGGGDRRSRETSFDSRFLGHEPGFSGGLLYQTVPLLLYIAKVLDSLGSILSPLLPQGGLLRRLRVIGHGLCFGQTTFG